MPEQWKAVRNVFLLSKPPVNEPQWWRNVYKKWSLLKVSFLNFFTSAWFGMLPAGKSNLVISNCRKLFLQRFIKREKLNLVITIEQTVLSSSNKNYKIDKISKLEKYITCYNYHHNNCVLLRLIKIMFKTQGGFECDF